MAISHHYAPFLSEPISELFTKTRHIWRTCPPLLKNHWNFLSFPNQICENSIVLLSNHFIHFLKKIAIHYNIRPKFCLSFYSTRAVQYINIKFRQLLANLKVFYLENCTPPWLSGNMLNNEVMSVSAQTIHSPTLFNQQSTLIAGAYVSLLYGSFALITIIARVEGTRTWSGNRNGV